MSQSAFRGTFSDFKLIRGRKCAQIVIEVPLEEADAALRALGGLPRPDQEAWVAVARLDPKAVAREPEKDVHEAKKRRPFADLPYPQQAALRCQDEAFRAFLNEKMHHNVHTPEETAQVIREHCGVLSRSEIAINPIAGTKWREVNNQFELWMLVP